jgi:putative YhdH/YhfP family quinone oxidoreductase
MSNNYQALWVTKSDDGEFQTQITERNTGDLPGGDVLVRVAYSSLNFKDMLSTQGHPGVTRNFPHQPGIDAAGVVEECGNAQFRPGDEVIVTGYDLGMGTAGGLGQYIRVPAEWVIPMPPGLSAREAMSYGTAGFTSALCLDKLIQMGAAPGDGLVAVTGATGGVGVFAISLLAKLGFQVAAATGKPETADMLRSLGACEVFPRQELADSKAPLGAPRFAHAVDALGGEYLANLLTVIDYGGSVACCGLAASPGLPATVMPFIIRDVNLLGVDSVEQPWARKQATWKKLGTEWKLENLDDLVEEISLEQVPESLEKLKQGTVVGRYLVNLQ